jgi:hypothetical protein
MSEFIQKKLQELKAAEKTKVVSQRVLVRIDWYDSRRGEGWIPVSEIEVGVAHCVSVGWIIAHDNCSITITSHFGDIPDQICGDMSIPRMAILRIKKLADGEDLVSEELHWPGEI